MHDSDQYLNTISKLYHTLSDAGARLIKRCGRDDGAKLVEQFGVMLGQIALDLLVPHELCEIT